MTQVDGNEGTQSQLTLRMCRLAFQKYIGPVFISTFARSRFPFLEPLVVVQARSKTSPAPSLTVVKKGMQLHAARYAVNDRKSQRLTNSSRVGVYWLLATKPSGPSFAERRPRPTLHPAYRKVEVTLYISEFPSVASIKNCVPPRGPWETAASWSRHLASLRVAECQPRVISGLP